MKRAKKLFTNFLKPFRILFNSMIKIIRLSRFKFDKNVIQHNVTFSVSSLMSSAFDLVKARIAIMTALVECLFPNKITIVSIKRNNIFADYHEKVLKELSLFNRFSSLSEGDEITLDMLDDVMMYCYGENLEFEADILDIKDQHVTMVINRGIQKYHYLYGTPITFTKEYIDSVKKKLPDCTFDGSFRKTL